MRNDLTIYDKVADQWWSDDIRWVRTLKNLVPGRLAWFDARIDWQGKAVLDLGCAGGFMAEALAQRGADVTGIDPAAEAIAPMRARLVCASAMMWVWARRCPTTMPSLMPWSALMCWNMWAI
jgi:2-polyprenyl-3-methyl-5-hydroxy-6-metoxy-1,4-benzoquinol methylase